MCERRPFTHSLIYVIPPLIKRGGYASASDNYLPFVLEIALFIKLLLLLFNWLSIAKKEGMCLYSCHNRSLNFVEEHRKARNESPRPRVECQY